MTEQLFFQLPAWTRHRSGDPDTSREAAESVKMRKNQKEVYEALALGPATDQQLTARIWQGGSVQSPSGIRTRRSELVMLGYVKDSGERRTLASGRKAIVWEVTGEAADDE